MHKQLMPEFIDRTDLAYNINTINVHVKNFYLIMGNRNSGVCNIKMNSDVRIDKLNINNKF